MTSIGLALLLSAGLAALATAVYLPLARRMAWLDAPQTRSAHVIPTPSSGGLALMPVLLLILVAYQYSETITLGSAEWRSLAAAALLCGLGAWDDRRALSVRLRLASQFFVAAWVLDGYQYFAAPALLSASLLIGLVWLVNLFNFMDGIDGIAALQCVLTGAALAVLAQLGGAPVAYGLVAATVAGVYLGFLVFNWPPARLFMGDAGSLSGGLLLGWLGLWAWQSDWLSMAAWLLLMSPFLVDTGVTLVRRTLRRERLAEAHKGHLYQRLARHWGRPLVVDLALLGLHGCWLFPLALAGSLGWLSPWTSLVIGLFPQLVLMAKWRALE